MCLLRTTIRSRFHRKKILYYCCRLCRDISFFEASVWSPFCKASTSLQRSDRSNIFYFTIFVSPLKGVHAFTITDCSHNEKLVITSNFFFRKLLKKKPSKSVKLMVAICSCICRLFKAHLTVKFTSRVLLSLNLYLWQRTWLNLNSSCIVFNAQIVQHMLNASVPIYEWS